MKLSRFTSGIDEHRGAEAQVFPWGKASVAYCIKGNGSKTDPSRIFETNVRFVIAIAIALSTSIFIISYYIYCSFLIALITSRPAAHYRQKWGAFRKIQIDEAISTFICMFKQNSCYLDWLVPVDCNSLRCMFQIFGPQTENARLPHLGLILIIFEYCWK